MIELKVRRGETAILTDPICSKINLMNNFNILFHDFSPILTCPHDQSWKPVDVTNIDEIITGQILLFLSYVVFKTILRHEHHMIVLYRRIYLEHVSNRNIKDLKTWIVP